MGQIRILSDQVANQIAAGEVVDRPASAVKELLENALDAGAMRIRVEVEGGGRKLIRVTDDGCGMNRDDALLAFERHATSKLRTTNDLLSIATLGFRGEALPSIASVARVTLETSCAEGERFGAGSRDRPESSVASAAQVRREAEMGSEASHPFGDSHISEARCGAPHTQVQAGHKTSVGTRIEIAGGKILRVEDAALPRGTTISVSDLFFNTPARRKFLRAESTELAHVTALVTHYALAHPEKHFELVSASHTIVAAPPVARTAERIYQIFGKETLAQLLPVAAESPLVHAGLPEPPPWKKDPDEPLRPPGTLRLTGFYSKPELQKLNRNSIYIFVNKRLIRDRLLLHAIVEAYRNVIPPTSFPVVLLFLEMPPEEVDVNVHPAKTEVRFRQQSLVHDFVRDSLRAALVKARPAAGFLAAVDAQPSASPSLMPPGTSPIPGAPLSAPLPLPDSDPSAIATIESNAEPFHLTPVVPAPIPGNLPFDIQALQTLAPDAPEPCSPNGSATYADPAAAAAAVEAEQAAATLNQLGSLKPIGQLRESFILASGDDGLWIIDQHVAHERILFEKILRDRQVERIQRQRLLMPLLVELKPEQMIVFARIAQELENNGFEVEPFGHQTLAVKAAPVGLEGAELERTLAEVIDQSTGDSDEPLRNEELTRLRTRIAASIACHSAIKVNTTLDPKRIEWLLLELAKTSHPTSCPHGRPIALLYSWKEILRAFHRI